MYWYILAYAFNNLTEVISIEQVGGTYVICSIEFGQ